MTALAPFNINDACIVADIVRACQGTKRVVWVEETGDLTYGTARHICSDENGGFISTKVDVRSGYVRITTDLGFERFIPMVDVMAWVHSGHMVFNPSV